MIVQMVLTKRTVHAIKTNSNVKMVAALKTDGDAVSFWTYFSTKIACFKLFSFYIFTRWLERLSR